MTLIEGIGDEVTHFFIALLVVVIGTIAWWTTGISEQRHIRTVLLLDRRHRTLNISHQHTLSNHTETITITEGSPIVTRSSVSESVASEPHIEEVASASEMTDSSTKPSEHAGTSSETATEDDETEQNDIIQAMDADTCVLRQRRIAFYDHLNTGDLPNHSEHTQTSGVEEVDSVNVAEEVLMEHNYADKERIITNDSHSSGVHDENSINIKLKYINDDLKQVSCNLEEKLGDFKRKHFDSELNNNKLVRLIFNGHVLHQDANTLRSYGLFDNCVVHCLIHPKRNHSQSGENIRSPSEETTASRTGSATQNLNNNQPREWDLGNLLIALVTIILVFAWYLRYLYGHLYTVTATIGLILVTGIYAVVLIGMNFPDTEPPARYRVLARVQAQRQQ